MSAVPLPWRVVLSRLREGRAPIPAAVCERATGARRAIPPFLLCFSHAIRRAFVSPMPFIIGIAIGGHRIIWRCRGGSSLARTQAHPRPHTRHNEAALYRMNDGGRISCGRDSDRVARGVLLFAFGRPPRSRPRRAQVGFAQRFTRRVGNGFRPSITAAIVLTIVVLSRKKSVLMAPFWNELAGPVCSTRL